MPETPNQQAATILNEFIDYLNAVESPLRTKGDAQLSAALTAGAEALTRQQAGVQAAFIAGWQACERLNDHEWGPSPPRTASQAFSEYAARSRAEREEK